MSSNTNVFVKDGKVRSAWWFVVAAIVAGGLLWFGIWLGGREPYKQVFATKEESVAADKDQSMGRIEAKADQPSVEDVAKAQNAAASPLSKVWINEALADAKDVASLLSLVDQEFNASQRSSAWSQPGFIVPAKSLFWSDLGANIVVPASVTRVRTQGNWGVYFTDQDYEVQPPNGGGRFVPTTWTPTMAKTEAEAVAKAPVAAETTTDRCSSMPDLSGKSVPEAIEVMDAWFEKTAWQFGNAFNKGETLPKDSIFWTNLGEGSWPVSHINAQGNWGVMEAEEAFVSPTGGRAVFCGGSMN